jgi:Protein of unknown function (DUF4232)
MAISVLLALTAVGCGGSATTVQKTVTAGAPAPVQSLVLAHRTPEGPRIEPGEHLQSATGCSHGAGGRVKVIHLYSDVGKCIRVEPRDRLLFVNSTGIGPAHREPNPVAVTLGGYEARVGPGQSALFPVPAGTYLAGGLHRADTHANSPAPSLMVLPDGCAIKRPKPGEGLCFAAAAPRCRPSRLRVHDDRTGAAAGTVYATFAVVNRSGRTCTVTGYPRVVALGADGVAIGAPAKADPALTTMRGAFPKVVALGPGKAAIFEMRWADAGVFPPGQCQPKATTALRFTLPRARGPRDVRYQLQRCAGERTQGLAVGRIE